MRRCLAVFAALSLFFLQAQSLAFHVHAAADAHHEDDHRHGPAIHDHGDAEFDRELHVEAEDMSAGGAVITMTVPAATASVAIVVCAEFTEALPPPDLQLVGDARAIDVRSHGPPPRTPTLLRGPPASIFL